MLLASLLPCRSGWQRRINRASISGGMLIAACRLRRRVSRSRRRAVFSAVSCASLSAATFLAFGLFFQQARQSVFQSSPSSRMKAAPHFRNGS